MSQATEVPESGSLDGGDVRDTVKEVGGRRLAVDALTRMRLADGFSHARASAFVLALLLVEAMIAVVGLAVALGSSQFSRTLVDVIEGAAPGPAGRLLSAAARQAQENGAQHQYTVLLIALVACVVTGTTAMGQFERSCNRVYGVKRDRPTLQKYGRAALLALSAGVLGTLALTILVLGRPIAEAVGSNDAAEVWVGLRLPLAVVLLVAATTALLRWSPNREQPGFTWLLYGATVSVLLTVVASLALAAFFRVSTTFGDTYGPLAGVIGLLLWCLAVATSGMYGIALTAELEAAGRHAQRSAPRPD